MENLKEIYKKYKDAGLFESVDSGIGNISQKNITNLADGVFSPQEKLIFVLQNGTNVKFSNIIGVYGTIAHLKKYKDYISNSLIGIYSDNPCYIPYPNTILIDKFLNIKEYGKVVGFEIFPDIEIFDVVFVKGGLKSGARKKKSFTKLPENIQSDIINFIQKNVQKIPQINKENFNLYQT